MNYIQATCKYCDHKWKLLNSFDTQCDKCGDKNPKLEEKDPRSNIDYYQGSPPFPLTLKGILDGSNTRDEPKPWYWDSNQSSKSFTLKDS